MKIKFTDSFIKGLKATGKPYSHGDTEHRGLEARHRQSRLQGRPA